MKKIIYTFIGVAMMMAACSKEEKEKTAADLLAERLQTLQQKGYMMGHQDDPFYGLTWEYQADSSDVKNTCGDYPAVMGFDLGGISWWNCSRQWASVSLSSWMEGTLEP